MAANEITFRAIRGETTVWAYINRRLVRVRSVRLAAFNLRARRAGF